MAYWHSFRSGTSLQTLQTLLQEVVQNQQQILGELRELATIFRVNQDIAPQAFLSAPVVFLDARGRWAHFNLEWIDSLEVCVEHFH